METVTARAELFVFFFLLSRFHPTQSPHEIASVGDISEVYPQGVVRDSPKFTRSFPWCLILSVLVLVNVFLYPLLIRNDGWWTAITVLQSVVLFIMLVDIVFSRSFEKGTIENIAQLVTRTIQIVVFGLAIVTLPPVAISILGVPRSNKWSAQIDEADKVISRQGHQKRSRRQARQPILCFLARHFSYVLYPRLALSTPLPRYLRIRSLMQDLSLVQLTYVPLLLTVRYRPLDAWSSRMAMTIRQPLMVAVPFVIGLLFVTAGQLRNYAAQPVPSIYLKATIDFLGLAGCQALTLDEIVQLFGYNGASSGAHLGSARFGTRSFAFPSTHGDQYTEVRLYGMFPGSPLNDPAAYGFSVVYDYSKFERQSVIFAEGRRLAAICLMVVLCLAVHYFVWRVLEVNLAELLQPLVEKARTLDPEGNLRLSRPQPSEHNLGAPRDQHRPFDDECLSLEDAVIKVTSLLNNFDSLKYVCWLCREGSRSASRAFVLSPVGVSATATNMYGPDSDHILTVLSPPSTPRPSPVCRSNTGAMRVLNTLLDTKEVDAPTLKFLMDNYMGQDELEIPMNGRRSSARPRLSSMRTGTVAHRSSVVTAGSSVQSKKASLDFSKPNNLESVPPVPKQPRALPATFERMKLFEHITPLDLQKLDSWEWDPWYYTREQLVAAVMQLFINLDLLDAESLTDADKLWSFLDELSKMYNEVPYHNWKHAADVTHTVYLLLRATDHRTQITTMEKFALMVAACAHDVGHPGTNNPFLVSTRDPLAITYNDNSVLENRHLAILYGLAASKPSCDIFSELSPEAWRECRKLIIDCILHTDMSNHFRMVSSLQQFADMCQRQRRHIQEYGGVTKDSIFESKEERMLMLHTLLHTADISNMLKPNQMALQWGTRVLEEFFSQGDKERAIGVPISPMMDRGATSIGLTQLNFIEFIVEPLLCQVVRLFPELSYMYGHLCQNYESYYHQTINEIKTGLANITHDALVRLSSIMKLQMFFFCSCRVFEPFYTRQRMCRAFIQ